MDQHYSKCDKHEELFWHTITWGEECPLCKIESSQNLPKEDAYSLLADVRALLCVGICEKDVNYLQKALDKINESEHFS